MSIAKVVFIFGFLVLFVGTGWETGVTGKDEFWVTMRTPLEMVERDSYWTLYLNDEVRLQKPPLIYWFISAGYTLFGANIWVARLVGVLSGAGMAAITCNLYKRLFNRSGFLAGITVLATAGVVVEGRRAMLDLPLGFFCLWAVYLALAAVQDRKTYLWIASAAALSAATLAKGPQSLLFVLPALLLGACLLSPRRPLRTLLLPGLLFLAVFLALTVPWPLSMRFLHADFIAELENQIVDNRLSQADWTSPLNALGAILLLSFPWSFVLLTGIGKGFASRNRKIIWCCGWLMCSVLPFFFMRSFERYMIPILPCAAILIVLTLETLQPKSRRILLGISGSLLALVSIVFSVFGLWFHLTFWTSILTLTMTAWMLWTAWRAKSLDRPIVASAWVFFFLLGAVYPRFGINQLPNSLPWSELQRSEVGIYSKYSQPAMLSMRLGRSVDFAREDRLNQNGYDGYIFTTLPEYQDPDPTDDKVAYLDHALRTAGIPYEEAGRYSVFFSRRNWIKFTRPDATREDWMHALKTRDLDALKSVIVYVRTGKEVENPHK
jgi:4-amino-4-deoxy-L-arabinose transferase-like glycosyltransferase